MCETANIKLEPLDIKEEYDYRSNASTDNDGQEHDIVIKEELLRVKEESDDFTVTLCDICRQYCVGGQELAAHRYTHTSDVTYTCLLCHGSYTRKSYLKKHVTTIHSDRNRKYVNIAAKGKLYDCGLCDMRFSNDCELSIHKRTHVRDECGYDDKIVPTSNFTVQKENSPFECDVCHMKITTKRNLGVHMRTHTGEKLYRCDICNKQFARPDHVTVHRRTHTKEKTHQCAICETQFALKTSLKKHVRTHTGEKPYVCDICNRQFATTSVRARHMRTHTGEKPYVCEVCNRQFARKDHVRTHMCIPCKIETV